MSLRISALLSPTNGAEGINPSARGKFLMSRQKNPAAMLGIWNRPGQKSVYCRIAGPSA
jgi:hypothetical protein